nr:cellular retinoic acid-binding protein 1-like [Lytechinus pictus]
MASSDELPNFSGYWKLTKNDENFEKYLQANGVNFMLRKVIKSATVYQDIEQDGNQFKIKIILPVATQELTFTVGEAFETYNSFRKVTLKRIANWDGQAIIIKSSDPASDEPEEKRELEDGFLYLTLTKGDVTTKRTFEKAVKK